jgi:extracellular factor (EF) 3-hydroxypalmitic acid methyl ester biosynthesis protein
MKTNGIETAGGVDGGTVVFGSGPGRETRGMLARLGKFSVAFELHGTSHTLRTSETLEDFRIIVRDRAIYAGRATVHSVSDTGTMVVCEAWLEDKAFDTSLVGALAETEDVAGLFRGFLHHWEKVCSVLPEFKVAVSDIQSFLIDLRRWTEELELGMRGLPKSEQPRREKAAITQLEPQVLPVIDALFEKFENLVEQLSPDLVPAHRAYIQRQLHPIVLCAPFADRAYRKPLGYAGDYEMVNMMLRDPQEGNSLFARLFNVWLLHQGSAAAHRNRVQYLKDRLVAETARAVRAGRPARVFNLGCGPAMEVQEFLAESVLSDQTEFTLMDFNEETLAFAREQLGRRREKHRRSGKLEFAKKSVQRLLKETSRDGRLPGDERYDLIYCAGLFDYLSDRTCSHLMKTFHQSLLPGGLVLATNVTPLSPNRGSLELILDWHLVYRDARQLATLAPDDAPTDQSRVIIDETGVNMFLETRKPDGP